MKNKKQIKSVCPTCGTIYNESLVLPWQCIECQCAKYEEEVANKWEGEE